MIKKSKNSEYFFIISIFLILSILINVYCLCKIVNYKYTIEQQSYTEMEDLRRINESNMDILTKSVENRSIKNDELLTLYKNYNVMAKNIMELWQQYAEYEQNSLPVFSKKIDTNKVIENDIYGKVKEYMSYTLSREMKNEKNKLVLENEDFECFEAMRDMSQRVYDYLNTFDSEILKGETGENKKRKIIKSHYWIDMLNGIYDICNDYVNVEWKIEAIES